MYREYLVHNFDHKNELRSPLKSMNEKEHNAALAELYVHHWLLENGYTPKVHPAVEGTSKTPDFLASRDGTPVFYIEVKTVNDSKELTEQKEEHYGINQLLQQVDAPGLHKSIRIVQHNPAKPLDWEEMMHRIQAWIDECRHKTIRQTSCATVEPENLYFREAGWVVDVAIRISPDGKQRSFGPALAFRPRIETVVNRSLIKKSPSNYGALDLPFIIALNILRTGGVNDENGLVNALLGMEQWHLSYDSDGSEAVDTSRRRDGFFSNPGYSSSGVSGVLVIRGLTLMSLGSVKPVLWENVSADYKLDQIELSVERRRFND